MKEKIIIYQVFTRLFGTPRRKNTPHGSIKDNGCGKMADFTAKALEEIKDLGATHIWYTGIIEHATQTDYSAYGIASDHPSVVKGKAGSPYAIKDYYDIDPDLAKQVDHRMQEFENLVKRTHAAGLKMVIDFVPNHVARQYHSDVAPAGVQDLGATDRTDHFFHRDNNFYYLPGTTLQAPVGTEGDPYHEEPAKATGNDCFSPTPSVNDWYETVKLNYGIDYSDGSRHFDPTPSTWVKMRDILLFWASKGVDAFRCDMAEMVPCEFWGWAINQVKGWYPDIVFIAEVYNPQEYRNYIHNGHFDYLYDKVGLYDTLRSVVGGQSASLITGSWQQVDDIHEHMLHFLENHDEQRIASDFFAGSAEKGRPALLVSALLRTSPMMIYFGQELGERGMDEEGFSGCDGRTTIFDYWCVDTLSRWRDKGTFSHLRLSAEERQLRDYYRRVLHLANEEECFREGTFFDLMYANYDNDAMDTNRQFAFVRQRGKDLILVIAHFGDTSVESSVRIPADLFHHYGLTAKKQTFNATDLLTGKKETITFAPDQCVTTLLPPQGGKLLKIKM